MDDEQKTKVGAATASAVIDIEEVKARIMDCMSSSANEETGEPLPCRINDFIKYIKNPENGIAVADQSGYTKQLAAAAKSLVDTGVLSTASGVYSFAI